MAYAFSPFHLAHAAYHPHIAQTQWVPLYLLALWRCLDDASPAAVGFLAAATLAVTLSNFYGGLIAAVITPVAVARVLARHAPGERTRSMRRLGITVGSLLLIAACRDRVRVVRRQRRRREPRGLRVPSRRSVPLQREMVELSRSAGRASAARRNRASRLDCSGHPRGTARTAGEPRLGNRRARAHRRRSGGWLSTAAIDGRRRSRVFRSSSSSPWLRSCARCRRSGRSVRSRSSGLRRFCTTSCRCSGRTRGSAWSCSSWRRCWRASEWIISAGPGPGARGLRASPSWCSPPASTRCRRRRCGATCCRRRRTGGSCSSRDRVRVLDCTPLNQESESVQWLTGDRVTLLGGSIDDCAEPNLSGKLAANGYTHLLVRRDTRRRTMVRRARRAGRTSAPPRISTMDRCSTVTARTPADLYRRDDGVLSARARCGVDVAMDGADAAWTIVNTSARPIVATLEHRTVGVPPCAAPGGAARRAPCADARRRATAPHLPDRSADRAVPASHELVVSSG